MALNEQLMDALKTAMREKNVVVRDTLRMLKSDLGAREVELGRALTEADELEVILRALKTRRESATEYKNGGRDDLADKELAEIAVLEQFAPKQMSEAEAEAAIKAIAEEVGATSKKQMGQLMKVVRERHQGTIDGKMASQIAGRILS